MHPENGNTPCSVVPTSVGGVLLLPSELEIWCSTLPRIRQSLLISERPSRLYFTAFSHFSLFSILSRIVCPFDHILPIGLTGKQGI